VVVFKRKQFLYQWLGIACCVLGLVLNGVASAHDTPASSSASKAVIGCVLVVAGMLASAVCCLHLRLHIFCDAANAVCQVQMVVEEKYLKGRNLPPDFVVGTEGMFGIVVMTCVVLPIVAHVPGHGTVVAFPWFLSMFDAWNSRYRWRWRTRELH
jgi:drug/metabolite transporter (DMT)-like permease